MIWRTGADGNITYLNEGWRQLTGRTWEQDQGLGAESAVHPEDREYATQVYRDAFAGKRPFAVEYRLRRADGSYVWMRGHGRPDFDVDGELAGFTGSAIMIDRPNNAIIRGAASVAA